MVRRLSLNKSCEAILFFRVILIHPQVGLKALRGERK
jgi:hypothetical protein